MKVASLLNGLLELVSRTDKDAGDYREQMKTLLKRMKDKERLLRGKCNDSRDEVKRAVLEKEIAILHAQRKKGMALLRAQKKQSH